MKTIVQITLVFALLFACAQQTTAQQLKGMSLEEIQKQFSSCSHNSAGATIKITSKEEMPVSLRCVMHDGNVQIMQLDSIADDILYGNRGVNSIPINHIKVIHIRGLTEISKVTLATVSFTIAGAALWFATYAALGNPISTHIDSKTYVIPAFAYTTFFSGISVLILSKPKTRFKLKKYQLSFNQ